ncbi:MAG TPA: hypothetical protein VFT06_15345 [Flavisolibacter sp.]|jgi:hypothetical protein|nr:hypothetical protein [Flavisolibacter sp.]
MQKFLHFEITMAIKDRPRIFQLIILALFSFSITVILVSSLSRLSPVVHEKQALRQGKVPGYAGFVATPAGQLINFKK